MHLWPLVLMHIVMFGEMVEEFVIFLSNQMEVSFAIAAMNLLFVPCRDIKLFCQMYLQGIKCFTSSNFTAAGIF